MHRFFDLSNLIIEESGKLVEKKIIGLKPGESMYEELMTKEEVEKSIETEDMYIITPHFKELLEDIEKERGMYPNAHKVKSKFYDSRNQDPISIQEIKNLLYPKNVLAVIQARMSSSRLQNKTLELIEEKPLLQHIIERMKVCKNINNIVIATTSNSSDDKIEELSKKLNMECFRGDEADVLDRFYQAAKKYSPDIIVRITADDPFKDPKITDFIISQLINNPDLDYVSNTIKPTYPEGIDIEVFTFNALEKAWKEAKQKPEREHVTHYIYNNPMIFNIKNIANEEDLSKLRWTIDYPEDMAFTKEIYKKLYNQKKVFLMEDILELLKNEPELLKINNKIKQRNWKI